MSSTPTGKARRLGLISVLAILFVIILVSLAFAFYKPTVQQSATTTRTSSNGPTPYVVVEIVDLASTTYTTTFTTTPHMSVSTVVLVEVLVVVNGTTSYTTTKTITSTSTTWT